MTPTTIYSPMGEYQSAGMSFSLRPFVRGYLPMYNKVNQVGERLLPLKINAYTIVKKKKKKNVDVNREEKNAQKMMERF